MSFVHQTIRIRGSKNGIFAIEFSVCLICCIFAQNRANHCLHLSFIKNSISMANIYYYYYSIVTIDRIECCKNGSDASNKNQLITTIDILIASRFHPPVIAVPLHRSGVGLCMVRSAHYGQWRNWKFIRLSLCGDQVNDRRYEMCKFFCLIITFESIVIPNGIAIA